MLKNKIQLWFALFFAMFILTGKSFSKEYELDRINRSYNDFSTTYNFLLDYYIYNLDPEKIMDEAIIGMLKNLDPYTELLNTQEMDEFSSLEKNYFVGIGIYTEKKKNLLTIVDILDGSPAAIAGLKVGDRIHYVDNKPVSALSQDEVRLLLKGNSGTDVMMKITRDGKNDTLEYKATRKEIPQSSVKFYYLLENDVAYVQIADFAIDTKTEIVKALDSLNKKTKEGLKGIVLDLRNNGGGIMLTALDIFEIFMPMKTYFGSVINKYDNNNQLFTKNQPLYEKTPLFLLVNDYSASASEFLAAALQDYDRAVIIGNKTYGKGISQIIKTLPSGKNLKITTEIYHTPQNRTINTIKIKPKFLADSNAAKIDSVYSKNKRILLNNSAVIPDTVVQQAKYANFIYDMILSDVFFDFVNLYTTKNPTMDRNFIISDSLFTEFKNFFDSKQDTLKNEVSETFDLIKKYMKDDSTDNVITDKFDIFIKEYNKHKVNSLDKYRKDIEQILKAELISRYYGNKAVSEFYLKSDNYLQAALNILKNKEYKRILKCN